jgi:hypothetical protein
MSGYRDLSIADMNAVTAGANDFMTRARVPLPIPSVVDLGSVGALPAMLREPVPAQLLLLHADLVVQFGIGDFNPTYDCSSYFDPKSAWYNVFFGVYALQSYKSDGAGWGYGADGQLLVDEFLRVTEIDYNFFAAGTLGCPPQAMCFETAPPVISHVQGWDLVDVLATIPSGLYDPRVAGASPASAALYGVPDPSFLAGGRQPHERVAMHGKFYMRQLRSVPGRLPITLAWGALCPTAGDGPALLDRLMAKLAKDYFAPK